MKKEGDYITINRESWNKRTDAHLQSAFYDLDGFLKGNNSLKQIELDLLGDITGKSILHLQCHFGQDSISLSRLGAHVTGVDLSDNAITNARSLAEQLGTDTRFICCNIYDLPAHLDETFDIVFTSYGTIGWLPDLDKWAAIVSRHLKPGGRFVFAEFHPVVWMFDDDFAKVSYNYFNTGPIIETEEGTYADKHAAITLDSVCWNHSISEVVNSLITNGLHLSLLQEFDYSPYDCFRHAIAVAPGIYRIAHLENNIPMVYTIVAIKG